jgi:hypothetical protein
LEGASVALSVGGGAFAGGGPSATGDTYSGGIFRATWIAPSPSSGAYVFPAVVNLAGIPTAEGVLDGTYRTNCNILVHCKEEKSGKIEGHVTYPPEEVNLTPFAVFTHAARGMLR